MTACHDCHYLLRHPDDPCGRFGCRKGAMRADLSVDWQPGDIERDEAGVRWFRVAVADLSPRSCPRFRPRGEDTPTDESGIPDDGDDPGDTTYIEDLPPNEEPATDTTEPPEADEPADTTPSPTWSEPTYSGNAAGYKAALRRRRAAQRKARTAPMFRCPVCGRLSPGVTLAGQPRRGCPDPRCRGRGMGDRARAQGAHRQEHLSPATVAAIRAEHASGQAGYRRLAEAYGCDRTTVRDIVTGRTHRDTPSPLPPGRVLPKGGAGQVPCESRSNPSHNPLKLRRQK